MDKTNKNCSHLSHVIKSFDNVRFGKALRANKTNATLEENEIYSPSPIQLHRRIYIFTPYKIY